MSRLAPNHPIPQPHISVGMWQAIFIAMAPVMFGVGGLASPKNHLYCSVGRYVGCRGPRLPQYIPIPIRNLVGITIALLKGSGLSRGPRDLHKCRPMQSPSSRHGQQSAWIPDNPPADNPPTIRVDCLQAYQSPLCPQGFSRPGQMTTYAHHDDMPTNARLRRQVSTRDGAHGHTGGQPEGIPTVPSGTYPGRVTQVTQVDADKPRLPEQTPVTRTNLEQTPGFHTRANPDRGYREGSRGLPGKPGKPGKPAETHDVRVDPDNPDVAHRVNADSDVRVDAYRVDAYRVDAYRVDADSDRDVRVNPDPGRPISTPVDADQTGGSGPPEQTPTIPRNPCPRKPRPAQPGDPDRRTRVLVGTTPPRDIPRSRTPSRIQPDPRKPGNRAHPGSPRTDRQTPVTPVTRGLPGQTGGPAFSRCLVGSIESNLIKQNRTFLFCSVRLYYVRLVLFLIILFNKFLDPFISFLVIFFPLFLYIFPLVPNLLIISSVYIVIYSCLYLFICKIVCINIIFHVFTFHEKIFTLPLLYKHLYSLRNKVMLYAPEPHPGGVLSACVSHMRNSKIYGGEMGGCVC